MAGDDDILPRLLANNRVWAAEVERDNPGFFERLAHQQTPRVLWVGCSDSRVPGNESIGLMPGEIFFHRNIANQMQMVDFNGLAVLQYAVDWLRVRHIVICGHYGCGGVKAALEGERLGLVDNWLRHVEDVRDAHAEALAALPDAQARWDRLCELNVITQVLHVSETTVMRDAWARGQEVTVHGWIYALRDGRLRDLRVSAGSPAEAARTHDEAVRLRVQQP